MKRKTMLSQRVGYWELRHWSAWCFAIHIWRVPAEVLADTRRMLPVWLNCANCKDQWRRDIGVQLFLKGWARHLTSSEGKSCQASACRYFGQCYACNFVGMFWGRPCWLGLLRRVQVLVAAKGRPVSDECLCIYIYSPDSSRTTKSVTSGKQFINIFKTFYIHSKS